MLSPFSTRLFLSAEAAGSASEARRLLALEQYAALKFELLKNTAGIGAGLSAYLAVAQHDVTSGVSVAVGVGGALAYLVLLGRHVDGLRPGSVRGFKPQRNPGENIVTVMLGAVQRVGDVYWCGSIVYVRPACVRCADANVRLDRNALGHPQLLVPVAIAAGGSAWNAADVGPDLQWIWVLVGFLSYKVAVLDQGWKALKAVTLYEKPSDRPVLKDLPDITDKLY
jgi:hypothetical protein